MIQNGTLSVVKWSQRRKKEKEKERKTQRDFLLCCYLIGRSFNFFTGIYRQISVHSLDNLSLVIPNNKTLEFSNITSFETITLWNTLLFWDTQILHVITELQINIITPSFHMLKYTTSRIAPLSASSYDIFNHYKDCLYYTSHRET